MTESSIDFNDVAITFCTTSDVKAASVVWDAQTFRRLGFCTAEKSSLGLDFWSWTVNRFWSPVPLWQNLFVLPKKPEEESEVGRQCLQVVAVFHNHSPRQGYTFSRHGNREEKEISTLVLICTARTRINGCAWLFTFTWRIKNGFSWNLPKQTFWICLPCFICSPWFELWTLLSISLAVL